MAFFEGPNSPDNFVISFASHPKGHFGVFARGYTRAAERLTQLLLDTRRFSDYEAYPVIFLYRHALELALKGIIYSAAELAAWNGRTDVESRLRNEHNLIELAATVSDVLRLLFPKDKGLKEAIEVVVETCAELSEIDPNSYSYRYPIDRQGRYSTKIHQVVNLRSFANRMSAVLDSLATVDFGLDLEIDTAQSARLALDSHYPSTSADPATDGDEDLC